MVVFGFVVVVVEVVGLVLCGRFLIAFSRFWMYASSAAISLFCCAVSWTCEYRSRATTKALVKLTAFFLVFWMTATLIVSPLTPRLLPLPAPLILPLVTTTSFVKCFVTFSFSALAAAASTTGWWA